MKCQIIALLLSISLTARAWDGFSSSNNLFATSIYKEILKTTNGNFLVSPFSAEMVLAFVQSGARNETAQELQTALHLPQDQEQIRSSIQAMLPTLVQNKGYSLHIADKMYVMDGCTLKNEFTKIATEVFHSEVESIDFSQTAEAAKIMNKWVEDHTNNKIHNLIDPDVLDRHARAVLINALHFQAKWRNVFGTRYTHSTDFHASKENVLKVATMRLENGLFDYYDNRELNAKFLKMPFKNPNASMVFILPNEKEGLADLEQKIDQVLLPQKFATTFIHVSLPKFKIESEFDFTEILKHLGVEQAFDEDRADLSGISEEKLHISKVAQKSYIDVNEGGVEAAAASYDVISPRIYALLHFAADHPFIFYIKVKDVIIFIGRVMIPSYDD